MMKLQIQVSASLTGSGLKECARRMEHKVSGLELTMPSISEAHLLLNNKLLALFKNLVCTSAHSHNKSA